MKKLKPKTIQEISAYVCDRCGRESKIDDPEAAEFTCIEFVGGYQSIFGDGTRVSADICQHCLKETLGAWIKVSNMLGPMKQSEVIARVEEVFGREKGQSWLHRPNIILNGKTPAEYIRTEDGIKEVLKILVAIEHGLVV
jgi:hypothetical protein